ncbi:MAG: HK97 gp10 family phage protein [Acutalibacteraceae bacterium]|nr:HK97 gp10 family phage protein [Acutalibacteraceae bacterium]
MAKTKSVAIQMKQILDEFDDKVNRVLNEAAVETADESADKLRNTSPRKSGEYAEGWTVKKEGDGNVIVHNTHYQLTHLLENGHVIRNKKGTYGRTSGIKHIKPVETWANKEFQNKIERGLNE